MALTGIGRAQRSEHDRPLTDALHGEHPFSGHRQLPEHGLIDMRGRTYDPAVGQFLMPDPISDVYAGIQQLNPYAYVLNNPLRFIDPSGFQEGGAGGLGPSGPIGGTTSDHTGPAGTEGFGGIPLSPPPESSSQQWVANGPEATAIERALYGGAGAGTGYLATRGVLVVCAATGVCAGAFGTALVVGGTAYFVYDLFIEGGINDIVNSFAYGSPDQVFDAGVKTGLILGPAAGLLPRGAARAVNNAVPARLARVIPGEVNATTLGRPGNADVFVTAADDIAGLTSAQIAERLAIQPSQTFTVIEFATPAEGLASPILRADPGFVGRGLTAGGAREFVLPNGPIPAGAIQWVVGP